MIEPAEKAFATKGGYPSFSEAEIARRHAALRALMAEAGLDWLIAYGAGRYNADLLWLSNWPGGREGYFLLPARGEPALLVQFYNHVPLARRLSVIPDTRWEGEDVASTIASMVFDRGGAGRIGLIGPWTHRDWLRLAGELPGAELIDVSAAYRAIRAVRSEEELAFFRRAADLTDRSMEALEAELRPGLREYELAAIVERSYLEAGGYAGIHYISTTSMADPEAFVPHQYLSDRTLQAGDVLISEISGSFWGYASQIHRTYTLGPADDTYRRLHDVAVETFDAVVGTLRDGTTVEEILDAAEVVHRHGYTIVDDLLHGAEQYPPVLRTWRTDHGHPAGMALHENMVITVQPHVVTPDLKRGLQFGETLRIARDGVESLHRYPRALIEVPV